MSVYEIYKNVIETGNFVVSSMEEKIETIYAQDRISAEERAELLSLASNKADGTKQIDIVAKLADLEQRIATLESKGVVTWTYGMSVAKGQTVLYDIDGDGVLDRCRYDGGRSATTLRPGKIDGWVVTDGDGNVTHTVSKDENGNIILVEVTN